ncbi:MAG: Zn-dependent exopeptidase M28, partial [Bdellovibrionales bacterium]|nr:Zn-dependent exopeptidase M28 [Bdellovibrionales bacterium]
GEIGRFGKFALVLKQGAEHVHLNAPGILWMRVDQEEQTYRVYPPVVLPQRLLKRLEVRGSLPTISIDPAFLQEKLSELSGAKPVVVNGKSVVIKERGSAEGRELARAYLAQEYQKLGFSVSVQAYQGLVPAGGANFIAEKKGSDNQKFVILSSHVDSVSNSGADDDGSGTISALAIAQALKNAKINMNLRIVAFDQEELGLVGAKAYAKYLDQNSEMKNLMGVFHLEMNGYHKKNDGGFHIIDCKQTTSTDLTAFVEAALKTHSIPLKKVDACTSGSDHSVFWRYGKPSIVTSENFFGGDGNNCYHKACDTVANLNFGYMARVVEANANALSAFLEAR